MMQPSKYLQALAIFLFIAFIGIDIINDRRPRKQSSEIRESSGNTQSTKGRGRDSLEHNMSWLASLNNTLKKKEFNNRARPIPREEWAKIDNTACIDQKKDVASDLEDYQRRAPYVLIAGAMKSGTSALNIYLQEHSNVMTSKKKELHFYDLLFDKYISEEGILRSDARQAYRETYQRNINLPLLKHNKGKIALDDSPRYLFWSERVPARVLCVTPWVKILAILRNPIDRAFSQYNMFTSHHGKIGKSTAFSFEEWIANDIEDMVDTGVLQNNVAAADFRNSPEEKAAWKAYTRLGSHAPIGRGFYALQLRQWFKAFEEAGKSLNDILVIQSELMKEDPNLVYGDVLDFLGLHHEPLKDSNKKYVGKYKSELAPDTREMLEHLYAPYNQELYELLGEDWTGVWDP